MHVESVREADDGTAGAAREIVVWPHHPDILQRPVVNGASPSATQAATWNVFRVLEMMPPAFWLRRLNASLGLVPPGPASVTARVTLWPQLPACSGAAGARLAPIDADVVIETEQAVWALLAPHGGDLFVGAGGMPDPLGALASAVSWHAGRRDCYAGVIVAAQDDAGLGTSLVRRYDSLPGALARRLPPRSHDTSNVKGLGVTTWERLVTIVRDASESDVIPAPERAIARRVVAWWDGRSAP